MEKCELWLNKELLVLPGSDSELSVSTDKESADGLWKVEPIRNPCQVSEKLVL